MKRSRVTPFVLVLGALALPFAAAQAADLRAIGKAGVVYPLTEGTPPEQAPRALSNGDTVHQHERIVTSTEGKAQILFSDESTLTLGPGSELVLDELIYDPDGSGNSLTVTLAKGLTRLIGGRISKTNPMTVSTPHGAIGIRGGMALIQVGAETLAIPLFGSMTCGQGGESELVTGRGTGCLIGDGIELVELTPEQIAALLALLEAPAGSTGGSAFDKEVLEALRLFCGSAAGASDPACAASDGGLAHAQPNDLNQGATASEDADLIDQQQDLGDQTIEQEIQPDDEDDGSM